MKHPKLMTAILRDGSEVTGVEVSQNIHGDEIILGCDGQEVPVNMYMCISYFESYELVDFDELNADESAELEKLDNLASALQYQSFY